MSACTHKTTNYNFENASAVKVDESKLVLTRFPVQLEEINDSIVAAINSYKTVSLYNIFSGKNVANFSLININFDSLIQQTFQKKYEGERKYNYNKGAVAGLAGMGEKTGLFQYIHNKFYICVSVLSEVSYLHDSTELLKLNENEKIKQFKKTHKEVNVRITDYVNFLFVTDDKFNLQEVIPLYTPPLFKNNNYYPIYERAFYVDGNDLHVFLLKTNEPYETVRSKKDVSSYYTAVINLEDETKTHFTLNNDAIDYSGFSYDDYLGSATKFYNKNNALLFFNGKEICEVKSGKKVFSRKNLKANEWVNSFYVNEVDHKIVLVDYEKDKKKTPTEFEEHYAIDSLNTARIRIFDTKNLQWIVEKKLPLTFHFPFLVTKNKIIYLDKDKQSYYFNCIKYNEEN